MARVDDYNEAFELGRRALEGTDPGVLAGLAGAGLLETSEERTSMSLNFLGREVVVSWPDLDIRPAGSDEILPVQQRVLIVHYLTGALSSGGSPVTGEWIAYQEVPDGRFYLDAFVKRAKQPLLAGFGERPDLLTELAGMAYGAVPLDHGDVSVVVRALPLVPIALILWRGDDEFPPEANLLFDRNVSGLLSAEDIAWLAGMVVYPLVGTAGKTG